ncbi:MAG: amidase [Chloroflexi bacterium]|nr:amidase [Chloroflexota bacterium]MBI4506505.1 amidase [Chloroflexota bacterium]
MPSDDLCWLSASELAERYARRELSPVEVIDAHLARAERLNPHLNAFITLLPEAARAAARRAEQELARGERRGPLHGVPVALKDIVNTRGVRTTMGSRIYAEFVPDEDSTVAARLAAAGAILLAKANTHEFAHGATTNNPHYGPCRNPWDRRRIPGGSSGGSGAAVGAGLVPIAIGTDTGGSIRLPALLCGVVGLMATYGLVSRYGVHPLSWTLDHAGPLTRTVRDAAVVLSVLAGYDPRDPTTMRVAVPDYSAALTGDVRGLRVGVVPERAAGPFDDDVRLAFDAALAQLGELGAIVEEVSIPSVVHAPMISNIVVEVEAAAVHEHLLRERLADYGVDVRNRLLAGFAISGLDYVRAQQARSRIIADVRDALERCDVLVGPTAPIAAPFIGQQTVVLGGQEQRVLTALSRFTRLDNLTGCPAITVPCGYTRGGLPTGLHVSGRPRDEATVLRVADAYERATAHARRQPPLDDLA